MLPTFRIPDNELEIEFVRSSGPGGQNVNKTSTKVQLRWNLFASPSFSQDNKRLLADKLAHRLTADGYIAIDSSHSRSQLQNKQAAINLLHQLISEALQPDTPRLPTKPTLSSRVQRLDTKRKRGTVKKLRKPVVEE